MGLRPTGRERGALPHCPGGRRRRGGAAAADAAGPGTRPAGSLRRVRGRAGRGDSRHGRGRHQRHARSSARTSAWNAGACIDPPAESARPYRSSSRRSRRRRRPASTTSPLTPPTCWRSSATRTARSSGPIGLSPSPRRRPILAPASGSDRWRTILAGRYHELGRHEEALAHFERALTANQELGDPERIRIARWTVARGLRQLGGTTKRCPYSKTCSRGDPRTATCMRSSPSCCRRSVARMRRSLMPSALGRLLAAQAG